MNGINYTNDPRAVLIHFNPNHDRLGRFARNTFGGGRHRGYRFNKEIV